MGVSVVVIVSPSPAPQWRIAESPTTPHRRAISPGLRLVIRIVISAALLGVLIWRLPEFEASELVPEWKPSVAWWSIGAGLTLLAAFALQTLRWNQVLRALDQHVPFRRLFPEFLAGQFISNVLPAAVGGDIVRVSRLGREIDDGPVAFASVALERLTGWLVLPIISLVVIGVTPEFQHLARHGTSIALTINVVSLVGLVGLLWVAAHRRWADAARNATGWRAWLGSVHLGLTAILSKPSSIVGAVVAGTAFQVTQCLSVWMTAQALGVKGITIAAALAFFPPTAIAQNLPVGFGGLGVREAAFVLFFGGLGVSDPRAIAVGLAGYLLTVLTSAFGAPAFALGGWKKELDEVDEAWEELEHGHLGSTAERTEAP